jgi:hypothetical protein
VNSRKKSHIRDPEPALWFSIGLDIWYDFQIAAAEKNKQRSGAVTLSDRGE